MGGRRDPNTIIKCRKKKKKPLLSPIKPKLESLSQTKKKKKKQNKTKQNLNLHKRIEYR